MAPCMSALCAAARCRDNGRMALPAARVLAEAAPVLSLRQLGVRFGPLTALQGLDLDVAAGELVVIAGENGAGKTTLVRCLAGDLTPTSGELLLFGKPVSTSPASV